MYCSIKLICKNIWCDNHLAVTKSCISHLKVRPYKHMLFSYFHYLMKTVHMTGRISTYSPDNLALFLSLLLSVKGHNLPVLVLLLLCK